MINISRLEKIASQVRRDIVRMVHNCQSGHPGGSLGCTELLVALYFEIMEYNKSFNMEGHDEDMFFLSNGHISPVWYSVLARSGFFDTSELSTFRKLNSRLQGHPATEENLPGIRVASGSLGQGLSVACGAALAKKMNGDNKHIFVLMGDGEQQEGQVWEAALFAPHHKLDNLIAIIDHNDQQIDGPVNKVLSLGSIKEKYISFGWYVLTCDGNNFSDLIETLNIAKKQTSNTKPIMIVMKTKMGKGVDFMEGSHKWHGIPPSDDELINALNQLEETTGDY